MTLPDGVISEELRPMQVQFSFQPLNDLGTGRTELNLFLSSP